MKIWVQSGSEHSANLVMIGCFADVALASKAKDALDKLVEQAAKEQQRGLLDGKSYSDEMLDLLGRLKVHAVGPADLEQFTYEVSVEVKNEKLVITTDELDIAAFLKVLISRGARIEVFSAHDFPQSGY